MVGDILNKNKANGIVSDLLKYLLCELKEKNIPISHFRIQKTVFKIKKELKDTHPLYGDLPFYWYEHGPFSNIVATEFNSLKHNNCDLYSSKTVFLNDNSFEKFSDNTYLIKKYPEIIDISQKIFEDRNNFLNKLDEDIYIDYAPFSFMHTFKYNLFEPFRNEDLNPEDYDYYLDSFYECLSNLPYDNRLNDFSILFSRLFSRLELLNDENQFENCLNYISESIQQSWMTFARWLSIYKHDTFYKNELPKWEKDLDQRVKKFHKTVNTLEDETEYIFNNYSPKTFTSFEERIYNATIGNYLKE